MNLPSNTPPDGDFVRYLERLTGNQAVAGASADRLMPKTGASAGTPFAASSGVPSTNAGLQPLTGMSFWTHVKWVVALWIVAQLLAIFVPGTGFLFIPVLVFYAAWVIFTIRRKLPGSFFKQ